MVFCIEKVKLSKYKLNNVFFLDKLGYVKAWSNIMILLLKTNYYMNPYSIFILNQPKRPHEPLVGKTKITKYYKTEGWWWWRKYDKRMTEECQKDARRMTKGWQKDDGRMTEGSPSWRHMLQTVWKHTSVFAILAYFSDI